MWGSLHVGMLVRWVLREHPVSSCHATRCHFSHVRLFVTLWIATCQVLCPWDAPGKNTGVGWHFLLQGIFPTQGSNPCHLGIILFCHAGMVTLVVKNLPANARDTCSIPASGRSPGIRNGNPFQYSCLKNPMDRRTWWAIVHMVTKSQTWLGTAWIFLYYGVSAISWFFHGYIDCCRICPHYQQSALVTSLPRHVPSTVLGTEILLNLHGHSWLLKVPQGLFQGHRHAVHTSCLRK